MNFTGIQRFEATLERVPGKPSFRQRGTEFPWSVTPDEGRFLAEAASLLAPGARCLEIATGFGYSTAWLSLGLPKAAVLASMDSYVEEKAGSDRVLGDGRFEEPLGLTTARRGLALAGTADKVSLCIASSPEDTRLILRDELGFMAGEGEHNFLNLFYLDGHHLNGQPMRDWKGVEAFIDPDTIILLHDTHVPDVKEVLRAAEAMFGYQHYHPGLTGYGLVLVAREGVRAMLENTAKRIRSGGIVYA